MHVPNIVGFGREAYDTVKKIVAQYKTKQDVEKILSHSDILSDDDIEKCIIGLCGQGLYNINPGGKYLERHEISFSCPDGVNEHEFEKKVSLQGNSFAILRKIILSLRESLHSSKKQEGLLREMLSESSEVCIPVNPVDFLHPDFSGLLFNGFGGRTNLQNITFIICEKSISPEDSISLEDFREICEKIKEYKKIYNFSLSFYISSDDSETIGKYLLISDVIDEVKIGKDFFYRIILKSTKRFHEYIKIFQKNGRKVSVEGVKNQDHLQLLKIFGVDLGQGSFYAEQRKV